jgi:hypothetical protein
MQDQSGSAGKEPENPLDAHEEEAMVGRAVLALVLSLHPTTRLTIYELSHELSRTPEDQTVERVVRDLIGAELLQLEGPFVVPTRAAIYLEQRGWIRGMTDPPPPPETTPNGG